MHAYELFAFDLDGTLLDAQGRIPPHTLGFVQELACIGRITVATGRSLPSAEPYIQELQVVIPVVLYHGAVVWDPMQKRALQSWHIPAELAFRLLERAALLPVDFQVYRSVEDPKVYVNAMSPRLQAFARHERLAVSEASDWTKILSSGVLKVLCVTEPHELPYVQSALEESVPELTVVRSASAYVEVLPAGITKGAALAWLCGELGVPMDRVVAAGDQMSDRTMIELAGLGVAMAEAPEELKAVAQRVISAVPELRDDIARGGDGRRDV